MQPMTAPLRTTPRPAMPASIEQTRLVAILRRTDPDRAVETAQALHAGGVRA